MTLAQRQRNRRQKFCRRRAAQPVRPDPIGQAGEREKKMAIDFSQTKWAEFADKVEENIALENEAEAFRNLQKRLRKALDYDPNPFWVTHNEDEDMNLVGEGKGPWLHPGQVYSILTADPYDPRYYHGPILGPGVIAKAYKILHNAGF